jgi:pimeloyl-ACP methyl ester carboxylesterase
MATPKRLPQPNGSSIARVIQSKRCDNHGFVPSLIGIARATSVPFRDITEAIGHQLKLPVTGGRQPIVPEQAAHGVFGWVDDTLAFADPWGFAPQLIVIPVLLGYGRADVLVPPPHGEWLATNIPAAAIVVSEHGGHLPSDPVAEIADNMAWLRHGVLPTN